MRILACGVLLYSTIVWSQMPSARRKPATDGLQMSFDTSRHANEAVLPDAPLPHTAGAGPSFPGAEPEQGNSTKPTAITPAMLSIRDAEQLAVRNNPQISVARLIALASHQSKREIESSLWPTAVADLTGVDSRPNSRITAGGLNNPIIYERAAVGVMVTQLITDFGHTSNLVSSAELSAKAQDENAVANADQVRLAVDRAFYAALEARTMTRVAEQTVKTRQTLVDQVQALFGSKLRSELDLSFANIDLSQAKLLLLDAQNRQNASLAALSQLLGYENVQNFQLVEDTTPIGPPPANVEALVSQAVSRRPEMLGMGFELRSAQKLHIAQRDLLFPTIRAAGAVGDTPVRNPVLSNWYGAVGVNIEIPVFNGFLYPARAEEARLRTQAAEYRLIDLRNRIARDVRTSWLDASTLFNRLSVTEQLLNQANLGLDLAQTRYKLGLGSIVELSQAELQQTQAQITNAQAGDDYRLALAVLRYQTSAF